ncbi:hypothetical protein ACF3NG_10110 [Aerococcaceae bacterium WGS1372]
MTIIEAMNKAREYEYNNLVKEFEDVKIPEHSNLSMDEFNTLLKKFEEMPMTLANHSFKLGYARGLVSNEENKRTNLSSNAVAYELDRVLPMLMTLNHRNRMIARDIQKDIADGETDTDEITIEMYDLEQMLLLAMDILESLEKLVNRAGY